MESRVLVTGGAGFIGSHVVRRLLDSGAKVIVIDNLASGRCENLPSHPKLCVRFGSILDAHLLREAIGEVSSVVHLAAEPSVQKSIECPAETHAINYGGTLAVLEAMRDAGVRKLVYASSAAVYSPLSEGAAREERGLGPVSPYGVDKLAGEFLIQAYGELYGIEGVCLRFFNVYGERQDPKSPYSGVISLFADALERDKPLTIYGDGRQTRDFVYAGDVAEAVCRCLPSEARTQVLNLGTGTESTLLDLVAALETAFERKATLRHLPGRAGEVRNSCADVRLLRDSLQFVPQTSLQDGLRKMIGAPV